MTLVEVLQRGDDALLARAAETAAACARASAAAARLLGAAGCAAACARAVPGADKDAAARLGEAYAAVARCAPVPGGAVDVARALGKHPATAGTCRAWLVAGVRAFALHGGRLEGAKPVAEVCKRNLDAALTGALPLDLVPPCLHLLDRLHVRRVSDESRRRRSCHVDNPRRRVRSRPAPWMVRGDEFGRDRRRG